MTQPFDQFAKHKQLGDLDEDAGEFWMENPWMAGGHNLSAYERNGVLLNQGNGKFVDISYLSGADLESDSRSIVSADFNQDGMPDLMLRNSGGGALYVFENQFPKTSWLTVKLRGTSSNSQGIGAKLKLEAAGKTIHRNLQTHNSLFSQMPSSVHFGLGDAERIDRLTIQWPSGIDQTLTNIEVNQRLVVEEPARKESEVVAEDSPE
ncbi:MAG: CRTAC1 family protein [Rubripirellula sp.]